MTDEGAPIRLGDEGQILLTQTVIREYARHRGLAPQDAQRELLSLLDEARPVDTHQTPELWRRRSRVHRVDISARVLREPPLLTVVAISARSEKRSRGGRGNRP